MGGHAAARPRRPGTGFRRLRAVLAGGLVLGVGATLSLAAWNDSEYATANFVASVFNTESNSGTGWAHNTTAPGATLTFAATGMSPEVSHFALLDVRTTAASTVAGTVALNSSAEAGALADALQYRSVLISAATICDAAAFGGTPTWIAGNASTYIASGEMPVSTPSTAIAAAAAQTLRYCFEVRIMPGTDNSFQGEEGTLTWGFTATSND